MKKGVQPALRFLAGASVCFFVFTQPVATANEAHIAWVQRYSGTTSADDQLQRIITDSQGDVLVAGYTRDGQTGGTAVLIKYSSDGSTLWTKRFSRGVGDIATDSQDNVVVAGSIAQGTNSAMLITKLSSSGVTIWTNVFRTTEDRSDFSVCVCVDKDDGIHVAGSSQIAGDDYDLIVLAYSSSGIPMWTNRYDGQGGTWDLPVNIAVDQTGVVFLTDLVYPLSANDPRTIVTIAYSTNGVPIWTNQIPGDNFNFGELLGLGSDQVYVAGTSQGQFQTVAYSKQGAALWTNYFSKSWSDVGGIAVGSSGDVYVTGSVMTLTSGEYATIAYSSSGLTLWTNYYKSTIGGGNARAIEVGSNGNIYVTGSSYGNATALDDYVTIAYSSSGVPLWTNRYNGPENQNEYAVDLAVDNTGRVFVGGFKSRYYGGAGVDYDWITVAYDGDGTAVWTNRYDGEASDNCMPAAVAMDQNGTVFVTGDYGGVTGPTHVVTVAYSSDATPLWTNQFMTIPGADDEAVALAASSNGNVYMVAVSSSRAEIIAYSNGGSPLWTNTVSGFEPKAAKTDRYGNIIVTGRVASGGNGYLTIAYAPSGLPLWTNRYSGPSGGGAARDLAIDTNGNVFVTGSSSAPTTSEDFATIAYSNSGLPLWTNRFAGPGLAQDVASSIVVGKGGKVFVGGYSIQNFLTIAYSNSGTPLWTNRFPKTGCGYDYQGPLLAVDENENVYVAGSLVVADGGSDYATIAYSSSGATLWTNYFGGPGNLYDQAWAIAVDGRGHVLVTGDSQILGSDYDLVTIAYSTNGLPMWTNRFNGPANGPDGFTVFHCIAAGPKAEVVVAGASNGDFSYQSRKRINYDMAIIKFVDLVAPMMLTPLQLPASDWKVQLEGSPGVNYTIEHSQSPVGPWDVLGPATAGANGFGDFIDNTPHQGTGFYRARVP